MSFTYFGFLQLGGLDDSIFFILWSLAMEIILYNSGESVQLCRYDGFDEMYHLAPQGIYLGTFFIDSR